jgi:Undecaprenyl-phosphate glucose phosphotransferase
MLENSESAVAEAPAAKAMNRPTRLPPEISQAYAGAMPQAAIAPRRFVRRFRFAGEERTLLLFMLCAADFVGLATAAVVAFGLWHEALFLTGRYWLQIGIGSAIGVQALQLAGRYRTETPWERRLTRSLVGWTVAALLIAALIFLLKEGDYFSRAWLAIWWVAGGLTLAVLELWYRRLMRSRMSRGMLTTRVAVFGDPEEATRIAREIEHSRGGHHRVIGIFHQTEPGTDNHSELDDLLRLVRRMRVDEIVLAARMSDKPDLSDAISRLAAVPVDVKLRLRHPASLGNLPYDLPPISIQRRPLSGSGALAKRLADIVISAVALVVLSPILLAVAYAVHRSGPGAILYRQRRAGFNLQVFDVYKFRTMYDDGDIQVTPSVRQAMRSDARVTPVGAFLRRFSLDELPQLLNVLRGEMSLVGPRPHAVPHDEKYSRLIDGYLLRHRVRPGITGWAQVNGFRGETETLDKMQARIKFDLWYIENWSLALDLKILALTAVRIWKDEAAY